jgi:hypothetical protein
MNILFEHEAQYIKDKNTSHRMVNALPHRHSSSRVYRFFSYNFLLQTELWNDKWLVCPDEDEKVRSRKTYEWLI